MFEIYTDYQWLKYTYIHTYIPSDDYTRNGTGKGDDGDNGWMFIRLPELILKLQPESFLITISDNVYNIHNGVELSSVKQNLKGKYILFESVLQCAYDFRFPKPKFDATLWPRARYIADPDCDVPDECWLDGNIHIEPERPSIHRMLTAKRKSGYWLEWRTLGWVCPITKQGVSVEAWDHH